MIRENSTGSPLILIWRMEGMVILFLNALLCKKFNLAVNTDTIVYHHWYDLDIGKRTNGTGKVKTCPGTAFFGGNSVEDARKYFIPLINSAVASL